eukprot:CAMPEP_0182854572 /NCGR_PEP_ID=MMETSP0034_2-20130328/1340_1 /TAXON_ID=156128 /ORGANISM="Nephroselmis pyriformis, Strain CCMP717" /LENGTH=132 /DNA_ID=CAMNT_0024985425 /DNA_START=416 /DNA_END=811 /DNA_ORIENTATION=-
MTASKTTPSRAGAMAAACSRPAGVRRESFHSQLQYSCTPPRARATLCSASPCLIRKRAVDPALARPPPPSAAHVAREAAKGLAGWAGSPAAPPGAAERVRRAGGWPQEAGRGAPLLLELPRESAGDDRAITP